MTDTPVIPKPARLPLRQQLKLAPVQIGLRLTLLFTPRPAAWMLRRSFELGSGPTAAALEKHAPDGVAITRDERYGDAPREHFDHYRPADATGPLPVIVWLHGGAWVGGSKEETWPYFQILAGAGYTVVVPEYGLAPKARYPTPLRQTMRLLTHLQTHAERLGIDPGRIVIAGDSAGAQIAAQVAALTTDPAYADTVGVQPTITPEQLCGAVLACGPYQLDMLLRGASSLGRGLTRATLWAYAGTRRYATDPRFATWSIADHLSASFPPTLLTVGDSDPLLGHAQLLADRLGVLGVRAETVFPAAGSERGHEYQFDLDTPDGQAFLDRAIAFLATVAQPARA